MIMGYEEPVLMPTMDIYSTDLMKAYIAGVKDQYEKGQEEYKDFMKAYSDFYSPIAADNEYYYNNTIGGANELINEMYANGIDPFKSPEARAAISRYIASRPTGTLANIRRTAEAAKEYQKNYGEMLANGATTPEYERWRLLNKYGMSDIANWNTAAMGALNETAPGAYRSAFDMVSPLLKDLDDTLLTKEDVEKMGYKYDPFYKYSGISPTLIEGVIGGNLGQLMNTPLMQYAYAQHKAAMETSFNSPVSNEDVIKSFLSGLVMGSAKKHLKLTEDYRAKAQYSAQLELENYQKELQIAYDYAIKKATETAKLEQKTKEEAMYSFIKNAEDSTRGRLELTSVNLNTRYKQIKIKSGETINAVNITPEEAKKLRQSGIQTYRVERTKDGKKVYVYYRPVSDEEIQHSAILDIPEKQRKAKLKNSKLVDGNRKDYVGGLWNALSSKTPMYDGSNDFVDIIMNGIKPNDIYTIPYMDYKISSTFTKKAKTPSQNILTNLLDFRNSILGEVFDSNDAGRFKITHHGTPILNDGKKHYMVEVSDFGKDHKYAEGLNFVIDLGSFDLMNDGTWVPSPEVSAFLPILDRVMSKGAADSDAVSIDNIWVNK